MRLLAIESSCDETSAAIIEDGQVQAVVVSSQIQIHAEYGGVVPELATREHLVNLQPVVRQVYFQKKLVQFQIMKDLDNLCPDFFLNK